MVEEVSWKVLSTSSVKVMWKLKGNERGQCIVFYSEEPNAPIHLWSQATVPANNTFVNVSTYKPCQTFY